MSTRKNSDKHKRSWVWKHFQETSSNIFRCTLCNAKLSIKRCNTNNMNRHMRLLHPHTYQREAMKSKSINFLEIDVPMDVKTEEIFANEIDLDDCLESPKPQRPHRSWIWLYFHRTSSTSAQCMLCNRHILHRGTSSGNMNRHLKVVHGKTKESEALPDWLSIYFLKTSINEYRCDICEDTFTIPDDNFKLLINHTKDKHKKIYDLHKESPQANEGVQSEFLDINLLKENESPLLLGEVCEKSTEEIIETDEPQQQEICEVTTEDIIEADEAAQSSEREYAEQTEVSKQIDEKILAEVSQRREVRDATTEEIIQTDEASRQSSEREYTEQTEVKEQKKNKIVIIPEAPKNTKRKRERSHTKTSWIWKYFLKTSSIHFQCTICNAVLSIKGFNSNNMNRHFRSLHPLIYQREAKKNKSTDFLEIEVPMAVKTEETCDSDKDMDDGSAKWDFSAASQRQRRSGIWQYFVRTSTNFGQCKLCHKNIAYGGVVTGNLKRHLKMKHREIGDDFLKEERNITSKEIKKMIKDEEHAPNNEKSFEIKESTGPEDIAEVFLKEERDETSKEKVKKIKDEEHGPNDKNTTFEIEESTGSEDITTPGCVAVNMVSSRGKTILKLKGHRYRKVYKSKNGTRWSCLADERCPAFVYLNDNNEIIMVMSNHDHGQC